MLYAALAFFAVSVTALVLGFMGVIRGAAGIANLTLLAALICLAFGGLARYWRTHHRHLHHH